MRMMTSGGLYGIDEIEAFRKGRDVTGTERDLTRVTILALTPEVAVATAEYRRHASGRRAPRPRSGFAAPRAGASPRPM